MQGLGFVIWTKMGVLKLIGQVLAAVQTTSSGNETLNAADFETMARQINSAAGVDDDVVGRSAFQRGVRTTMGLNGLSLNDLLTGAQRVADAVEKYQTINE